MADHLPDSGKLIAFPEIPLFHAAAGEPIAADGDTYAPTRDPGPGRITGHAAWWSWSVFRGVARLGTTTKVAEFSHELRDRFPHSDVGFFGRSTLILKV